jgi:hypothetical protein
MGKSKSFFEYTCFLLVGEMLELSPLVDTVGPERCRGGEGRKGEVVLVVLCAGSLRVVHREHCLADSSWLDVSFLCVLLTP